MYNTEVTMAKCKYCGKLHEADKPCKCEKKHIVVECRKCKNCTGFSCKIYGNDADIAVKKCADDGFKNYEVQQ